MEWRTLERWLPAAAVVAGLLLMTAAAVGQESEPGAASTEPSATAQPGAPGHWNRHAGGERHQHFGGHFAGMRPEAACKERFAREAGFLAYLGAKLDLTGPQQPLWDAYHQAMLDAAGKQRQTCLDNVLAPDSYLTTLERRDRIQKVLQVRVDGLQSTRPSLAALYQALTPGQRQLVDRPFRGRFWARGGER